MTTWNGIKQWFRRTAKLWFAVPGFFALVWMIKITSFSLTPQEQKAEDPEYKIYGLNFPKNLNFAGEKVPAHDILVRESFDREILVNTYWQSNALLMHKRANRWFPVIEPILKKHGIPDDFKYVAIVESGLTNSVSPQQATGYWQIIASTAEMYGLEVSEEVDERYNVELATEAACKYFKEAYRKFGNWTLAAASYNIGMGGLEGHLKRQKVSTYYDLLLNEETSRYVFRILAVKELISKPEEYGFKLRKRDLYPPIPTYKIYVDSSITDLADFAIKQGVNYKILKIFNPWLRRSYLTNPQKKKYAITLPKKEYLTSSFDEEATGAFDSIAPGDSAEGHIYMGPVMHEVDTSADKPTVHIVKEGETAALIAKQYNVDESKLRLWNKLPDKEKLKPGQELVIFTGKELKKQ